MKNSFNEAQYTYHYDPHIETQSDGRDLNSYTGSTHIANEAKSYQKISPWTFKGLHLHGDYRIRGLRDKVI